jgi:hypothetical protein
MDTANIRHLLHIPGKKLTILLILFLGVAEAYGQAFTENLPFSDTKWLHYGFSIGLHSSSFKLKYSDKFTTAEMDSVHSIMPQNSFGFSLGFITDFKIKEQINLRVLPKVTFYEYGVDFNYTDSTTNTQLIEATFIEIPILVKFKSQRHRNFRAYVLGGITPGIEVSGKKRKELSDNKLLTQDFNLSADIGIGMDMYFPLFKFSPEIRFSRGLLNMLKEDNFGYSDGIKELKTNVFTIFLQFSD